MLLSVCVSVKGGVPEDGTCVEAYSEGTLRLAWRWVYRDPLSCLCQTQGKIQCLFLNQSGIIDSTYLHSNLIQPVFLEHG